MPGGICPLIVLNCQPCRFRALRFVLARSPPNPPILPPSAMRAFLRHIRAHPAAYFAALLVRRRADPFPLILAPYRPSAPPRPASKRPPERPSRAFRPCRRRPSAAQIRRPRRPAARRPAWRPGLARRRAARAPARLHRRGGRAGRGVGWPSRSGGGCLFCMVA